MNGTPSKRVKRSGKTRGFTGHIDLNNARWSLQSVARYKRFKSIPKNQRANQLSFRYKSVVRGGGGDPETPSGIAPLSENDP